MALKVGDWVIISPDLDIEKEYKVGINNQMLEHRGEITRIKSASILGITYKLEDIRWNWSEEMLIPMNKQSLLHQFFQGKIDESELRIYLKEIGEM